MRQQTARCEAARMRTNGFDAEAEKTDPENRLTASFHYAVTSPLTLVCRLRKNRGMAYGWGRMGTVKQTTKSYYQTLRTSPTDP